MQQTLGLKDLLGSGETIDRERWLVSMVRKQNSKNPQHVFLIIQGQAEDGSHQFYRAHLVLGDASAGSQHASIVGQKAEIELEDWSEALVFGPKKVSDYLSHCVHRHKRLSKQQAEALLKAIEADQQKDIRYSVWVNKQSVQQMSIQIGVSKETQNCASWAEWVLSRQQIELSSSGWLGVFVVMPKVLVPDSENERTSGNCLVM